MGRKFEEALQKALRMVDESVVGLDPHVVKASEEVCEREGRRHKSGVTGHSDSTRHFYFTKKPEHIVNWSVPVAKAIMTS